MTGLLPFKADLRTEAEAWMQQNPAIFRLFERFALDMASRRRRFGIGQLTERVRWEILVEWRSADGFKINNNHRAYIARRLLEEHPELEGLISTRRVRA